MKTHTLLAATTFVVLSITSPALAGLNDPPSGPTAQKRVAVGDLGMAIMSAAIIGADGTIARGEGVVATGTSRLSTGTYEVGFGRDITACAYAVTVGESGIGGATPAVTGVTRRSGNPNGVFIRIVNPPDEAAEDRDFFVLVYCGR